MAVVVIDNGAIAWLKGYGLADREKGVPVDPGLTQFRWASNSKPVTAIAALQRAEKGLLDLDADVPNDVPEFPDKRAKITARNFLCHKGDLVGHDGSQTKVKTALVLDPDGKKGIAIMTGSEWADVIRKPVHYCGSFRR